MQENLPQIYGTQWTQENGKFLLYTVDNIKELDMRRSKIGLCSIAEYKEIIKQTYQLTDEDFKE